MARSDVEEQPPPQGERERAIERMRQRGVKLAKRPLDTPSDASLESSA